MKVSFVIALILAATTAAAQDPEISTVITTMKQHMDDLHTMQQLTEPGQYTADSSATQLPEQTSIKLGMRDPFALTPLMLGEKRATPSGDNVADNLPQLQLRGLAQRPGEQGLALIEIEGGNVIMLRPGEAVSVHAGQKSMTLRLIRIHASSAEIETNGMQVVVQ